MDEIAKTEARNYLCAAGFFILAAYFILTIFFRLGSTAFVEQNDFQNIALGIGLLIVATLLIVLRKRDMIAILFFIMGFIHLFSAFTSPGTWNTILAGFMLLVALVTLTGQDKKKYMLILIPAIIFITHVITVCIGYNQSIFLIFSIVLAVISLYYAFCCACERCNLPGAKTLTADATTDFKASGSVLGYMLFALISGGFALYYLLGESLLPFASLMTIQLITGFLLIFVAVLLLAVGRMRFTPVMFLLMGLTAVLNIFSSGMMYVGIGILFLVIGLFCILRKESRIMPGIMVILVSIAVFIHDAGGIQELSVLAAVLECIAAALAVYLSFVVYSQRKLPKF